MRDRLIELRHEAMKLSKNASSDIERDMIFADYLLANGVIVPPCKVGDTVYVVDGSADEVAIGVITHLEYNIYTTPREWIAIRVEHPIFGLRHIKEKVDLAIGKTVFLTREEAERALKGGEG